MTRDEFRETQDYKDICYMIDHVEDLNARISVLQELGYRIGVNAIKPYNMLKSILIGKDNSFRVQITPRVGNLTFAQCAIVENKDKKKKKQKHHVNTKQKQ